MGIGDEIMGSGMARGAAARGKRIAFGDGRRIRWHANAHMVFRNNPNVAPPGSERASDLEWIAHYVGHRSYFHPKRPQNGRWRFNPNFTASPGEFFFNADEEQFCKDAALMQDAIVIEPWIKIEASPNKQWLVDRYRSVAKALGQAGYKVVQFEYGRGHMPEARAFQAPSFRHAVTAMRRAALYIGGEGALHHAAAAVGVPGVVIFGGFIHPRTTGYAIHTNLFSGNEPCGSRFKCGHCTNAMNAIGVDLVVRSALAHLEKQSTCRTSA
jgi:ADP-heptose:LPS heptosyltransferase